MRELIQLRAVWATLIVLGVLLTARLVTQARLESEILGALGARLHAAHAGDVRALRLWADQQKELARLQAAEPVARRAVLELIAQGRAGASPQALRRSPALADLRRTLGAVVREVGYLGFVVSDASGRTVGALFDSPLGQRSLAGYPELVPRALRDGAAITPPALSEIPLPEPGTRDWTRRTQLLVAAPVRDEKGRPVAVLAFRLSPDRALGKVFEPARWGESGESYGFDRAGRMLGRSRFEETLRSAGLLGREAGGTRTSQGVALRDPGGELAAGHRPAGSPSSWPLTRAVEAGTAGRDGLDVKGYRDYRGATVVGAWSWLPELGFGAVTEMDLAEVRRPLRQLSQTFVVVIPVLLLMALLGMRLELRARRRAAEVLDLFDHAVVGALQIREDGRVTRLNAMARQILGCPSGPRRPDPFPTFLEEPTGWADVVARVRVGERVSDLPVELRGRDGQQRTVLLDASGRFHFGRLAEVRVFLRDVTEARKAERELQRLHAELLEASRQAGMAEVATSVLHNVGNVLNSANVSGQLLHRGLKELRHEGVGKAATLLRTHEERITSALPELPQLSSVPTYLAALGAHLAGERTRLLDEARRLLEHLDHLRHVVSLQQSYAENLGVKEFVALKDVVEASVELNVEAFQQASVTVERAYDELPPQLLDRHRVMQILVNLLRNAGQAMEQCPAEARVVRVRVEKNGEPQVKVHVIDRGIGMSAEALARVFEFGFTTKKTGHGFGLHSCANLAREMGGRLSCHSEGQGKGATFTLELPFQQS